MTSSRIALGILAIGIAIVLLPLLGAFEAHVINVTAQISEQCINHIPDITFGTVFPQERLDRTFDVELSESFKASPDMDVIEYQIVQHPKCWDENALDPTFGEVFVNGSGVFDCVDPGFSMLPLLCPYLSKSEITADGDEIENDGPPLPAFHGLPGAWTPETGTSTAVFGRLIDSALDDADTWNIDLKVPCFGGYCAQDWAAFVQEINPDANPDDYVQPFELNGELFGCDLVLYADKVTCEGKLDLMLVLDKSSSLDATELQTLKDAANAFVTTLAPSMDGVHIGQTSFATEGILDLHLTDVEADVHAAINGLTIGVFTNLKEGIELATAELDDAHEHERPLVSDVMVIITDGLPTRPFPGATTTAATAADAARAAGIEVFVVGIGVTPTTELYLQTDIADDLAHYFSSANFADLEAILAELPVCALAD